MKVTILCPDSAASHEVVATIVQTAQQAGLPADVQLDTSREARHQHGPGTEPVVLVNGKPLPTDSWQQPAKLEKLLRAATLTAKPDGAKPAGCESSTWLTSGCQGCPMAADASGGCCSGSTDGRSRKIVVAVMLILLAAGIVFVLAQGRRQDSKASKAVPMTEELQPANTVENP